nr:transposase [uncultured Martelella sp.]
MERTVRGQLGFLDLDERYARLSAVGDPLEKLNDIIPWPVFEKPLAKALKRSDGSKGGHSPFPAVMMFKILVLQAIYNLSDDQAEFVIQNRLSFMRFLGLSLSEKVPDAWKDIHHSDKGGGQYVSIKCSERLAAQGIDGFR